MKFARFFVAVALAGLVGIATGADAQASSHKFYKGKRMSLIVGYPAGGGYDTYTRLLAKHMKKHVPGNPSVIVKNMVGAGSIKAASYLANIAPKDGTVFGTFSRSITLTKLLGTMKMDFDPFKLTYLGSLSSYKDDAYMVLVRADTPYKTIKDLQDPGQPPAIFSATAPGSTGYDVPFMLKTVLGLRLKIIAGYPGSKQGALAFDRNEVNGVSQGLSSIRATQPHWIAEKKGRFLLQYGRFTRHPSFPNVPTGRELAPNAEALALIKLQEAPLFMARPYAAPPGMPAGRTKALKKAFMDTANDPVFVDAGKRLKIDISPIDGDKVQAILDDLKKSPPAVFAKYKAIMASRPPLPMVKHMGPVTKIKRGGRRVWIKYKGKEVKAKVSGSRTKVTINGKKTKRKNIKVGMTCTFVYPSAGSTAKKIDCKG
jgi:tripartite-type tricarboxylate transporter receptor subunit TctC